MWKINERSAIRQCADAYGRDHQINVKHARSFAIPTLASYANEAALLLFLNLHRNQTKDFAMLSPLDGRQLDAESIWVLLL